jgi:hypothetical protein
VREGAYSSLRDGQVISKHYCGKKRDRDLDETHELQGVIVRVSARAVEGKDREGK